MDVRDLAEGQNLSLDCTSVWSPECKEYWCRVMQLEALWIGGRAESELRLYLSMEPRMSRVLV